VKDGKILYEFFEKYMAANTVLHAKTALCDFAKTCSGTFVETPEHLKT
jgi:hypothetical protein